MVQSEKVRDCIAKYVAALAESLEQHGITVSQGVIDAFSHVERHRFLEGFYRWDQQRTYVPCDPQDPSCEALKEIYSLNVLLIKVSPPSTCSEPGLVAMMLESLKLEKGMKVLEIGGGTGYNAALMADIIGPQGSVTAVEIQPDLAQRTRRLISEAGYGNVHVYPGDGFYGWSQGGPYDRIVATTCCFDISPHWRDQLKQDGWMLIPLKHRRSTPLTQVLKNGKGRFLAGAGFLPGTGLLSDAGLWPEVDRAFPKDSPIEEVPWPLPKWMKRQRDLPFLWDFELLMALNWPEVPSDLWLRWSEEEGVQFICSGEAGKLYKLLKRLYSEYVAIGSPKLGDFRTEFTFVPECLSPCVKRIGRKEWVVDRRYTSQRVWVSD